MSEVKNGVSEVIEKIGKLHLKKPSKNNQKNGRTNGKYKAWRKAVYERDYYTCRVCGRKGYLNAHHIRGYTRHKNLRYEVRNGFTMCRWCHYKFHKKYGKSNFPSIVKLINEGKLNLNNSEKKETKLNGKKD